MYGVMYAQAYRTVLIQVYRLLVFSTTGTRIVYWTRGDRAYRANKKWKKNIFSAPSSGPLICASDTTLESQEHGANSELSGLQIRGLELFHFLYGDTSERVILKYFTPILQKKIT